MDHPSLELASAILSLCNKIVKSKSRLKIQGLRMEHILRKIRGFHCGGYEECCLLGCYVVWLL
jgi:hypothetical protein